MPDHDPPQAVIATRSRPSIAWLLPALAIAAAAILTWQAWHHRGIPIRITFDDAAGLRPGNELIYRGVPVGQVKDIRLANDTKHVIIDATLRAEAESLAVRGTNFWIAKPEISLTSVSGLDTLLGPTYIHVAPGADGLSGPTNGAANHAASPGNPTLSPPKPAFEFQGLSTPPPNIPQDRGLHLVLRIARRGAVSVGSPILYRDIPVGRVEAVRLAENARRVEVDALILEKYARLVHEKTRFFKATGIGIDFGWFGGLSVRADSLDTIVNGALAFATPEKPGQQAADGDQFDVADEPEDNWLKWDPDLSSVNSNT